MALEEDFDLGSEVQDIPRRQIGKIIEVIDTVREQSVLVAYPDGSERRYTGSELWSLGPV